MTQICYYGDKLSPNIAKTPEGFLVCRNVPIARTGYQQYLESELFEDGSPSEVVNVYRSPNEVFSLATLASFEGKPVTDNHPDVDVTPENYKLFSKGHVQHVRIGKGDDSDKILADLYITDKDLIEAIQNGKREVSAGYYAEDKEDNTGRICQTKIRGNHVAVVDEGRAGKSVCIRDSAKDIVCSNPNFKEGEKRMKMTRKQKVADLIVKYLKDAAPEELEERMKDAAEVLNDEACKEDEEMKEEEVKEDACKDAPDMEELWKAIDSINMRLEALESKENEAKLDEEPAPLAEDEDEVIVEGDDDEIIEDEGEDDDQVEVEGDDDEVIEDEDPEEEDEVEIIPTEEVEAKLSAKDAAIKRISKAALKIKNPEDRKRVQDAIIKATRKGKSQMPGLMKAVKANQNSKKDNNSSKVLSVEAIQKIYDKLNPHKGE